MKSCTTLFSFCLLLGSPLLSFGQLPVSKRLLNEVAAEATPQVSTPLAQPSVPPQAATEGAASEKMADLRPLVERYYIAYARKDIEAMLAEWSSQSPNFAQRRESLQQFFAASDKIVINDIVLREQGVEAGRARFRVTFEMSTTDVKTAISMPRLEQIYDFEFTKKPTWKIWREVDVIEELAAAMVAAPPGERRSLLDGEKELITASMVNLLVQRARDLNITKDTSRALRILTLAQEIAERLDDQAALSSVHLEAGKSHVLEGNYHRSLECDLESLQAAEKTGDQRLIARALNDVAGDRRMLGDSLSSLAIRKRGLEMAESLHDSKLIIGFLMGLGGDFAAQGQYAQAEEYYKKALVLEEKAGNNPAWVAPLLYSLGGLGQQQNNYAQAMEYYQRALALVENGKVHPLLRVNILSQIGAVLSESGEYEAALGYYQRSMAISEKVGSNKDVSEVLEYMGELEVMRHDYDAALTVLRKLLPLAEQSGEKRRISHILRLLGDVYFLRNDGIRALDFHRQSLAMAEEMEKPLLIAQSCRRVGSDYLQQGKVDMALEYAERAAHIAETVNDRASLWEAQTDAGRAYRALGETAKARQSFEEAIHAIESMRADIAGGEQEQQRFFETKITPYEEMVELLVGQNQNREAFLFAEQAKGKALLDVLRNGKTQIMKAMTDTERNEEQRLEEALVSSNAQIQGEKRQPKPDQQRLDALLKQLEEARVAYNQFHISLYAAHPELRTQRGQVQPLAPEDAAQMLPDGGAFLEFLVSEKMTYLFVITRNNGGAAPELKVYPIEINQEELAHRAEEFRQKLAQRDLNVRVPAHQLYDLLLKPAKEQLAGKNALIIVPDGPLWDLPFQALRESNSYLLEKYAVAYSPSLTVLREMMSLHEKNRQAGADAQSSTLLAMADPKLGRQSLAHAATVYRDEKLGPLPEARQEVQALKRVYGTGQSEIYTGADAREDHFKAEAGKFRILHLATHGILDNANPMYSNILLSPGDSTKEDGLLEAREIMQMDLKADLAVLSACETARGYISAGEGVIGLSWAFFVAGTSTTVVSQWKVESASTADLMLAFHRNLINPNKGGDAFSTARALQRAEIGLLRHQKYAHPFYWAGFIVVGNPN